MRKNFSMIFAFIFVFVFMFSLNIPLEAREITAKNCKILQQAWSGLYSPQDLCQKYDGHFCSSVTLMGQAICAANGQPFCTSYKNDGQAMCEAVDGSFCSSIKTVAGGLCAMLGLSFCSSETDEVKWKRKIAEACYW